MPLYCVRVNYEFSKCVEASSPEQAIETAMQQDPWEWDQIADSPPEAELVEE